MKSISKKIIALMITVMLVMLGGTSVKAAGSSVTLTSDEKLVAGSTITINVSLAGGLNGFSGELEYDKNVFEDAEMSSVNKFNVSLAESTNIATVDKETNIAQTTQVAKITLKVKDTINVTSTTVRIIDIKDTDSSTTVSTGGIATITFDTEKTPTNGGTTGTPVTNTPSNTPSTTNGNQNGSTTGKNTTKNITTSKTTSNKLPKAGDQATIAIISAVAIITVIGIVGFVKYTKNKDIK